MYKPQITIIGGGAAGMFAAINCAEMYPHCRICVLEKGKRLLEKVRISGGGRCNVTHACFEPSLLVKNYPRGGTELLSAFQRFQPADTVAWFKQHGVTLKTEADGRMFPISDDAQTIIDCFMAAAHHSEVMHYKQVQITAFDQPHDAQNTWNIAFTCENKSQIYSIKSDIVLIATGSSTNMWKQLAQWGHQIIQPIPSLFTFNSKDPRLNDLSGLSVSHVALQLQHSKIKTEGPMLITHWGLSGPAVLRLSAFAAPELHERRYNTMLQVNWVPMFSNNELIDQLHSFRQQDAKKSVWANPKFQIPLRLWQRLMAYIALPETSKWADLSNKSLVACSDILQNSQIEIQGKSVYKDEFVTCGGVLLKELNFKTMESRLLPRLFLAGEVLNIDAITGGFNFQAAWTTAFIAAQGMKRYIDTAP